MTNQASSPPLSRYDNVVTSQLDDAFIAATPLADGETQAGTLAYQVDTETSPLYWVFGFGRLGSGEKTFWTIE